MAEINMSKYVDPATSPATQGAVIRQWLQSARLTGDPVYFPARVYEIDNWIFDSALNFDLSTFKGITIRGDGPGRTIIKLMNTAALSNPIFHISGGNVQPEPDSENRYKWFTLRDMTLDGNYKTATWLKFYRADLHRLDNIEFKNTVGPAIHGVNFWDTLLYNCTFNNCYASATGAAVRLEGEPATAPDKPESTNNLKFDCCDWKNNARSVFMTNGGGVEAGVKVCEFLSCRVEKSSAGVSQFRLEDCYGVAISQSQFVSQGPHIAATDVSGMSNTYSRGTLVFGSTFQNLSTNTSYTAVRVDRASYTVCTADYFNASIMPQIYFGTGTDNIKAHNTPTTA